MISTFYKIGLTRARHSRKFRSSQNVFHVSVKELPENNPTFIRRLFRDVIKNVKQKMETLPNDYIRINIDHPSLDSPIWIEFTQSKHLDEDKILNKIEGVQQSKKEFVISDGGMEIDFFFTSNILRGAEEPKRSTYIWTRRNLRRVKEPLWRLLILGILCVYPVPSL